MRKSTRAALALALFTGTWIGTVHAEQDSNLSDQDITYSYEAGDVTVSEQAKDAPHPAPLVQRTGTTGFFGEKDVMDVPFTQTNITNKAIAMFDDGTSPLPNALLMSPSVRTSSSTMYNDFSIRGFAMNAYQFKVNGVPGMFSQTNMPSNFVERMEVISGPAIGIHGSSNVESAGGSVSLVTKRASYGKEQLTYKQTIGGGGAIGAIFDFGKRFGKDEQWGLRINAENIQGKTSVEDEKLTTRDFYINLDHAGTRSATNLFAGYRYTKNAGGQRYFVFDGTGANAYTGDRLPSPPSGKRNYSFPGQHITVQTWTAVLNHEQKLNERWQAFFHAGFSDNDGYDYVMTSSSRLYMRNASGDFANSLWTYPYGVRNSYVQLGIKGTFDIGNVKNDVVLALDRNWYTSYFGYGRDGKFGSQVPSFGTVSGSLRDGVTNLVMNYDPDSVKRYRSGATVYSGISLADTLTYGKASVLLGIHHHGVRATSYASTSGYQTGKTIASNANSPTFGIVYHPTDDISLYANHTQSFDKGTAVTTSERMNTGSILPPAKTKQNEIGVKYWKNGIRAGLSLFQIEQDRTMDVTHAGDPMPTTVMEGKNKYRGLELSVSGQIAPKWTLTGGLMHLSTEQKSSTALNGKDVIGVADWSGMLTLEYAADETLSAFTRMIYSGTASVFTSANRRLEVPSYVTVDIGANYQTKIGTVPTTFSLTAYNVFDKRYWMSRPGYNFGIQGYPRTLMLSMTMDI